MQTTNFQRLPPQVAGFISRNDIAIACLLAIMFVCGCAQAPHHQTKHSIPLSQVAEQLAMGVVWDPAQKTAILAREEYVVAIQPGSDMAMVCGIAQKMPFAAYRSGREIHIPLEFYQNCLRSTLAKPTETLDTEIDNFIPEIKWDKEQLHGCCVVLDAGHGGRDPGAMTSQGIQEKNMTLAIAQKLTQYLNQENVTVKQTRPDDTYVTLEKRVAIANQSRADCFVSIHLNSASAHAAHGFELWIHREAPHLDYVRNMLLARYLRAALKKTSLHDRGIRKSNFRVIRDTKMPGVLVECAFISNPQDLEWLGSAQNQEALAYYLAQGILGFLAKNRK